MIYPEFYLYFFFNFYWFVYFQRKYIIIIIIFQIYKIYKTSKNGSIITIYITLTYHNKNMLLFWGLRNNRTEIHK